MKITALLAIFLAPTAYAGDLIGSTIPPYPDGFTETSSACVAGSTLGSKRSCDYSIGILEGSNDSAKIIYGARQVGRNSTGSAIWKVTDAMPHPSIQHGQTLSVATCTVNGKADEALIAVAQTEDSEWYDNVLWVRRYDLESEKFSDHPAENVRCLNEAWGL